MLSKGNYKARAIGGEFGQAKSGTDQVVVVFEVTEGPDRGSRISWYGFFTEKAQARTIESLQHCGCTFPGDTVTDLTGLDLNEVELVVDVETYEGKERSKVQWVNKLGGPNLKNQMGAAEKASFADRMRGLVASKRSSEKDDNLPF